MVGTQEPIRSVGMLRMLRRQCFELYKIDEFRTSTLCPSDERIQYMKEKLREKSGDESRAEDDPGATVEGRYWNRNIAAALNFKTITHSLRTVKRVPERFNRNLRQTPEQQRQ
ncbi:hypothetical protein IW140_003226 [Coemansia sp. RSA 1813]|nr:hypothetical protein EV178_002479 [Coemansia sp. RSA 1646]KAJ2213759.1 hypothetical protein EV179_003558 [Coemansia sp. RSA 487]KAJ2569251.1 hypothetical protein IW140_003226 [Coemansia sp. RSA 1813]